MADEDDGIDEDAEEGEEGLEGDELTEGLEKKRFSGKKIVIAAVAAVVILGGAGIAFMMSGSDADHDIEGEGEGEHINQTVVFYDLPEMLVNMNTGTRQASYLKIQVALELSDPLVLEQLDQLSPRIIDIFQVYLRELRLEDLDGSAGMFRLKEELLKRANASVAPIHINDILFREMIVQ
ncbi:MAG: flagellar basal body-associated FliL family protein [Sphingomonadales bacterium]|nr:flagellar basal body-associated FliL family protein [Sphingomonadales bacterium]